VFANARGRPADYTNLRRRVLAPAVKAAGIPPIGFHALRHTATTDLLRVGVPLKAVSELLGHHSVEFTLSVYSHVLAGDRPDLDALFGKAAR
jgi:integrase